MWVLGWDALGQERVAAQERFEQLSIGVGKVGNGAASNKAAGKDSNPRQMPAKPVPPQGVEEAGSQESKEKKTAKKTQTIPDAIIAMLAMETKIKTVISQATKTYSDCKFYPHQVAKKWVAFCWSVVGKDLPF